MKHASLPRNLRQQAERIETLARSHGLDFFPVVFEMLDARDVNAVAAYGGFPVRYPSWRFGMEFERLEKGRCWGLSKIYELVINNDPTIAYLVRSNSVMEQKLVMAHVFGHADFFKHNLWFGPTGRGMLNRMSDHGERIRQTMKSLGQDRVEDFLDSALSLDNLIDPFLPLRRKMRQTEVLEENRVESTRESPSERARKSFERASRSPLEETAFHPAPQTTDAVNVNPPTYDVLGFLAEEAPLERWQRDLLRIVREEAYYFSPQRMTKIMNEGWASFWHSRMLTEGILESDEIVDFADCHSGATAAQPGQLNPYKLGIDLFRHAEEKGLDIFRLRRMHNDTSFLDELIDEEFAAKSQLFVLGHNSRTGRTEVLDRDWRGVKAQLLQQMTHGGLPQIELVDRDFEGRGELLFEHHHDGRDLQLSVSSESLKRIAVMWRLPVHLRTQEEGEERHFVADPGEEVRLLEPKAAVVTGESPGSESESGAAQA